MKTNTITSEEYENLKIASLPTNPTADVNYGGFGYTASQMKAAFDALPLFIIRKLNDLIDDINAEPEAAISAVIKTGLSEGHTLLDLFSDIKSGTAASYFKVGDGDLAGIIASMEQRLAALEGGK